MVTRTFINKYDDRPLIRLLNIFGFLQINLNFWPKISTILLGNTLLYCHICFFSSSSFLKDKKANFLVLWIATRLGCLRIFKFGLLTQGLLTQNWQPVNNPTRVVLDRQPVV
jgi:hypothetical protein